MSPSRIRRRAGLDALRGVAVLMVVASHAYPDHVEMAGPAGVAAFFCLSGYLICGLLVRDLDTTGRIPLREFYRRRACRLLPALLVFLAVVVALGAALGPAFATWRDALPVVLYVQNFAHMDPMLIHSLGHTWSLSVEEQFYVVFPLLLIGLHRWVPRAHLASVLLASATALLVWRTALWWSGATLERVYYGTDTNAGLLLLGAAVAARAGLGPRRAPTSLLLTGVGALVALGFVADSLGARAVVPIVAGAVTAGLLALSAGGAEPPRWLTPGWLLLVGRRSYGLYLWHYPFFHVLLPRMDGAWWNVWVLAALSWAVTLVSWHFVEKPFLRERPARASAPARPARSAAAPSGGSRTTAARASAGSGPPATGGPGPAAAR